MFFELVSDLDVSLLATVGDRLERALDCRYGPMRSAMAAASADVMRSEHARFVTASGGGGAWPDLAYQTKYRRIRRQVKESGSKAVVSQSVVLGQHLSILYVSGTLEAGLFDRGAEGHFLEHDENAVREGVRDGKHPDFDGTVGELAAIHQYGKGRVPQRPVLGEPDPQTRAVVAGLLGGGLHDVFDQLAAGVAGASPRQAG